MKIFLPIPLFAIALCFLVFLSGRAYARGETPPLPVFTGGNVGAWLGSGPLFGFENPNGPDFPPEPDPLGGGGHSGGNGSGGYEWDPTGGVSGSGGSGGSIGSCDCGIACECMKVDQWKCDHRIVPPCNCKCYCYVTGSGAVSNGPVTFLVGKCRARTENVDCNQGCCHDGAQCRFVGFSR